ncbi:MAG TPA: AmpG family muropeptide MFS transporter [Longimicrobiaceae bacterium]|nr:AmpG family muropeptide MFS transporter [Longimicrobiaceae bacterium]
MAAERSPSLLRVFGQPKMVALVVLGFSSGLPLYLTSRTLQAWMTVENVDLTTVGLVSLLGLPYSAKFLWAPVLDRYVPPFLGRRRGWLVITQVALLLAIAAMSLQDPRTGLQLLAVNALLIAFFSATQDIAFNAYQVDVLDERELGAGASLGVLGYRIALILTGGIALVMADYMPWPTVYLLMALLMGVGIVAAVRAPEPVLRDSPPLTFGSAVVGPVAEFFRRTGEGWGIVILLFAICYQLADRFAANLATPFLLDIGFTQTEIGAVQGVIGLGATIVGVLAGGAIIAKLGINRSVWIFAFLQIGSNLAYYWVARVGANRSAMTVAIVVENFAGGLVTAVFVAFMLSLCNKKFSATQYALLSSLMAFARDFIVAPSGSVAERTGWPTYFLLTLLAGIPAVLLLPFVVPWNRDVPRGAAEHTGEVEEHGERAGGNRPAPGGAA